MARMIIIMIHCWEIVGQLEEGKMREYGSAHVMSAPPILAAGG